MAAGTTVAQRLRAEHKDFIHDVAYDFYGRRMVTCGSDHMVSIYNQEGDEQAPEGRWQLVCQFKAHDAPVLRAGWAHPEFGQVIATCSTDRELIIWEEPEILQSGKAWVQKAQLVDSRAALQDFEFAPKHQGLKIAAVSADGYVRLYEAIDVMDVGRWTLMDDFEIVANSKERDGSYCLSWCPSRLHPAMLAVGCGRENCVRIYRYKDQNRKWMPAVTLPHPDVVHDVAWAPNIGRSFHLIATACRDGIVRIWRVKDDVASEPVEFNDHQAEVWRVSWNVTGTVLASSGDDGKVRLYKANFKEEWNCTSVIKAPEA